MPSCVAHYQFGRDVLCRLGSDLQSSVEEYEKEYVIGLQGPDIFFFYRPYSKNRISQYGEARHSQSAIRMFAPILENVLEKAALSYMLGLVCHYVLDKRCHPYVNFHSRNISDHRLMESAFDRYTMSLNGLTMPRYFISRFWFGLPGDGLALARNGRGHSEEMR
jgi:hypothetical protein